MKTSSVAKCEINRMKQTLVVAGLETPAERRLKLEIANTAARFRGATRLQYPEIAAALVRLIDDLEIESKVPPNCPACGRMLDIEGHHHD
ncbi:hypothetical protein [Methylomonas rhizoryzae]|uniref:hypothetical protein n=1 Tax=Methylomonas rhizoryzae TaxID=2608981 RepID=UPI0012327D3D|nr:hypothetical protein [Methylomonas rhizoryzae]